MAGIGRQSAGTTSAGYGTPGTAREQLGVVLRDEKTGASFGGRKVGPATGDYELDEYGRLLGMPNVQQLVLLAVLNSAPALAEIDRLSTGFEQAATAILSSELALLVARGLIEIVGVRDLRAGVRGGLKQGQAVYRFIWRDLTTNTEQSTAV